MPDDILSRHAAALERVRQLEAAIARMNALRWAALTAPSPWQARAAHAEADRAIDEMKAEAEL